MAAGRDWVKRSVLFGGIAVAVLAAGGIGVGVVVPHLAHAALERDIATFRASLPPGASLTYAKATPHPFSRSATLEHVELHETDGSTLSADRAEIAPDGPHRLRHLHARGVSLHAARDGRDIVLKAATLDGEGLRDDATPMTLPPAPAGAAVAEPTPITRAAGRAQHVAADTLSLDGVQATRSGPDGSPGPAMTIASLRVRDFGPGRSSDVSLDRLVLSGLSYSAPVTPRIGPGQLAPQLHIVHTASIVLDSAALHHIRLADEIAFLAAGRRDGPRRLGQPGDLHLAGLVASVDGGQGAQAGPGAGELRFGDIRIAARDTAPKTRTDLDITGIDLPAGHLPGLMPGVFADGRLHGTLLARGSGDNSTGAFDLQVGQLAFDHIGTLRVSMQGWIDPQHLDAPQVPHDILAATTFSAVALTIADGGLRDALLRRSAAAAGSTPDDIATLISARVQAMLGPLGPAGTQLAPALGAFLAQGGALSITAKPAQPIALAALNTGTMDATIGMLNALNLDATRTPALPPLPQ